jgi:hypothetical protein
MPFITIWKFLVLLLLLIVFKFDIKSHCCSPLPQFCLLAWFSHLHLILHAKVSKLLCSAVFLTASSLLLIPRWSVMVCALVFPLSTSVRLDISIIDDIYSSSPRIGGIRPSPYNPPPPQFFYFTDCQQELCYASSFFQNTVRCLRLSSPRVFQIPI